MNDWTANKSNMSHLKFAIIAGEKLEFHCLGLVWKIVRLENDVRIGGS